MFHLSSRPRQFESFDEFAAKANVHKLLAFFDPIRDLKKREVFLLKREFKARRS